MVNRTEIETAVVSTSKHLRHHDVSGLKRHGVCAFLIFPSVHYVCYL